MRRFISEATIGLFCVLNIQVGCDTSVQPSNAPIKIQTDHVLSTVEQDQEDLKKQIIAFAEGEGDDSILQDFKTLPQDSLMASIEHIRDNASINDPIRVKIAFLFCRLGYLYSENRAIVVTGLSHPPRYEGFYADQAVGMLASLIRGGDKNLLSVTFKAAKDADGALAEGLTAIFIENLRERPDRLLQELTYVDSDTRKEVYKLVGFAIATTYDSDKIKAYLSSVPKESEGYSMAKEMLQVLNYRLKHNP